MKLELLPSRDARCCLLHTGVVPKRKRRAQDRMYRRYPGWVRLLPQTGGAERPTAPSISTSINACENRSEGRFAALALVGSVLLVLQSQLEPRQQALDSRT